MTPPGDDLIRWMEKDYDDARAAIDKFDGQLFTIRNWAVTSAGALLALGFSTENAIVPLVGLVPVALFAYLETTYKCFHEDAINRGRLMEEIINRSIATGKPPPGGYRFGLSTAFHNPSPARVWKVLKVRKHITFMYLGLAAALVTASGVIAVADGTAGAPSRVPAPTPSASETL